MIFWALFACYSGDFDVERGFPDGDDWALSNQDFSGEVGVDTDTGDFVDTGTGFEDFVDTGGFEDFVDTGDQTDVIDSGIRNDVGAI